MGLKEARESIMMTQQEAADHFGIKRSTISMWETGKSLPRADLLPKIAKLYRCSIDDLYRGCTDAAACGEGGQEV